MRNLIFFFIFIVLCAFCAEASVIDACGREIFAPEKPRRIVAIGPGASALTVYADVSKRLVAREVYGRSGKTANFCPCVYPKGYGSMPIVYRNIPSSLPDYKIIKDVKPDLIIASGFTQSQVNDIYKNTLVPVAAVNCGESSYMHFDSIIQSIRLTGYVLRKEQNMQDIMNYMMKIRKELYDRTVNVTPYKVFIISETYAQSSASFTSERCYAYLNMLRLKNAPSVSGKQVYSSVSKQQVLKLQPDYIFIEFPLLASFKKDYMANKDFYGKLNAVRRGHVYTIMPYNRFSADLENLLMNSYFIGKLLYPDKFTDLTMKDISDEITEEFTGNDIYDNVMRNTPVFRNLIFTKKGIMLK